MGWYDNDDIWYYGAGTTSTGTSGDSCTTSTGTSGDSFFFYSISSNKTAITGTGCDWNTNYVTITGAYVALRQRTIYVEMPEHYSVEACEEYASLVNSNDFGGWKVKAIIRGKICITDPDDEIREFGDFLPLLRSRASTTALGALEIFLAKYPLAVPPAPPETPASDANPQQ